jgi:glycine cleavage system transcriptional repressor
MKQLIAISAIGGDRTGLVYDLTRVVVDCGGNVLESRMAALGNEFAMLLLVSGNWHTLAKLEGELQKLGEASGMTISARRTEVKPPRPDTVNYTVDVVCLDQPGVLHSLAGFFSSRGVDIGDISTPSYSAAHTGAPMPRFAGVTCRPASSLLPEEFMDLCDNLNLDAILEPMKACQYGGQDRRARQEGGSALPATGGTAEAVWLHGRTSSTSTTRQYDRLHAGRHRHRDLYPQFAAERRLSACQWTLRVAREIQDQIRVSV